MKKLRLAVSIAAITATPMMTGCASMLAKMALGLATSKTSDLSVCALQARYITNLYPKDANTFELPYYSMSWSESDDIVTVSCSARQGAELFQIEGTVQVDGQPMDAMPGGTYSKIIPKGERGPKTIQIVTNVGQKAEFQVKPTQPLNLISVNGSTDTATVDVTKDLVLKFGDLPTENTTIKVNLLTISGGMRNFASLGTYKLEKELTVPAVAFKHPQLFVRSGSNSASEGRTTGKTLTASSEYASEGNYVVVERFEEIPLKLNGVPTAEQLALGWSWKAAHVKGEATAVPGIVTSGELKSENGGVAYVVTKPNAHLGKPLVKAKKFALVSLTINGRLKRETITEEHVSSALKSTTTKHDFNGQEIQGKGDTTNVWQFPKVPLAYWDSELEKFHADLTTLFQEEFGIDLVPFEQMTAAKAYQDFSPATDSFSEDSIQRPFRANRLLQGPRVGSATFAHDRTDVQLMRELGVDGLVAVEVGVDLDIKKKQVNKLLSKVTYQIIGSPQDYSRLTTTYSEGEISTPEGIEFKNDEFKDASAMSRVIRRAEIIKGLRVALKEEEATAKKLGYEALWMQRPIESAPQGLSFLNQ